MSQNLVALRGRRPIPDSSCANLLERVAELVDAGTVRTTLTTELGPINAATLRHAHELIESGRTIGKIVATGF